VTFWICTPIPLKPPFSDATCDPAHKGMKGGLRGDVGHTKGLCVQCGFDTNHSHPLASITSDKTHSRKLFRDYGLCILDPRSVELATQLRLLDNHESVSDYLKHMKYPPLGKIIKPDEVEEPLYFRDMTNKIMHSSAIEWNLSDADNPIIICHSPDRARWVRAEIELSRLAFYCGGMIS
jgi:hypothetical protein